MEKTVEAWLSEFPSDNTAKQHKHRIDKFLEVMGYKESDLLKFEADEIRHTILKYQKELLKEYSKNTTVNYVSTVRQYFEFLGIAIKLKNKIVKSPRTTEKPYHYFSNGDAYNLIEISPVPYKALFATLFSSGWSISDVLEMDKAFIKSKLESAKVKGQQFVFYETTRGKTGSRMLCVLNPLAIKWLSKWLEQNDSETLWNFKYRAILDMFKNLCRKAIPHLEGEPRIHNIRRWTINSLIKAGFSSEEWHYCVGKNIKASDEVYLRLKPIIEEKYPQRYDKYLSLETVITKESSETVEALKAKIQELEGVIRILTNLNKQPIRESYSTITKSKSTTTSTTPYEMAVELSKNKQ